MTEEQEIQYAIALEELERLLLEECCYLSRGDFTEFMKLTLEGLQLTDFHKSYYGILNRFANKEIKKLIISVPPQHGKSEGSSRKLPSFLHGQNPNLKIALLSYSGPFAQKFNRDIKRTLYTDEYKQTFDETTINEKSVVTSQGWKNTQEEYEVIDKRGSLKAVGVGGSLTGESVDVLIMDDLYKDYQDAVSNTVSQKVWDWFLTVAQTRLHNESQEIIVFTRWDENDVIGRLEKNGVVVDAVECDSLEDAIHKAGSDKYLKINFEAIKTGSPNWLDKRKSGQALYPQKHSVKKLRALQAFDAQKFDSLYQGQPRNKEGLMYTGFGEYTVLPPKKCTKSRTDTADTGKDYLCSIVYDVPLDAKDKRLYVRDVLYTQDKMEVTEPQTASLFTDNESRINIIESNNGGRGFSRAVSAKVGKKITVRWFTQTQNKQARIYSNSASVQCTIMFPVGWRTRWPEFASHIESYKKDGSSEFDDAPDCLTGCYEEEFEKSELWVN